MSNVVIGYPNVSEESLEWLQSLRKIYDRQYSAVNPHVTFVFPSEKLSIEQLTRHTSSKMDDLSKFVIELTQASIVEDHTGEYFHVFLLPSTGKEQIIQLHDALYTDELKSELRADIPYVPHVSIATIEDRSSAQILADSINNDGICIKGSIDTLTIAEFDGNKVRDINHVQLA